MSNNIQNRDTAWRWWDQKGDQNLVKDENMFRSDIDLQRRIFYEACLHSGFKIEYFEAEKETRDIYYDPIVRWKESIVLPCIFEDYPKPKILKDYGWFEADSETQSQVLYLPMYKNWETKEVLDIKDQSLFRINYFGQVSPNDYRLVDKRYDTVYAIYWILRLAPEHLDNFYYVTDHGSHYLKRKPDSSVKCEHKKDSENETDDRIYQHEDLEAYLSGSEGEKVSDNLPYSEELVSRDSDGEFHTYEQLILEDDGDVSYSSLIMGDD